MRNTSAYVKIVSLAVLMGILYWRDFNAPLEPVLSFERGRIDALIGGRIAALIDMLYRGEFVELLQAILSFEWMDLVGLLQAILSIKWIVFTVTIGSLFFVSLYQKRKTLKALVFISENNNKQGAIFLGSAIGLYVIGSYTAYVLWLHWCSLILFIIAYIMLRVDFRIARVLFVPFLALLFAVPAPIGNGFIGAWSFPTLIAVVVVTLFLAYILEASIFGRAKDVKPCPLCRFGGMEEEEAFCPHCGRQRSPSKPASTRSTITKFFTMLMIVSVLSFIFIPAFFLTSQGGAVRFYTPYGAESQSILPTPQGWVLESSVRQTDYERERFEDFVILNRYSSEKYAENKSYILLEIGPQPPYMMDSWRLPGWDRSLEKALVTEDVTGTRVILRRQNDTMTVLYWTMPLIFEVDAVYQTKQAGVSIYMESTEPISAHLSEIFAEFTRISVSIIESWKPIRKWTLHASTLNEIYALNKDLFLIALSVVGVFLFAVWARAKDEKVEKSAENAFFFLEKESLLLLAVSTMKKRKFTGGEVFETYKRFARTPEDVNQFYEKMRELLRFDLLKKGYALRNNELLMVWERKFPSI